MTTPGGTQTGSTGQAMPSPVTSPSPSDTASTNPSLVKLPPPTGLRTDERVEASDAADLNGDGVLEQVYLLRNEAEELWLQITDILSPSPKPARRKIIGSEETADLLRGPGVSALLLERFTDSETNDVAIGFDGLSYGDSQWAIYRYVPGDANPIRLMRLEPFAVDTGIISLRDEDTDGRYERMQYPGHVVRVHRYEESLNGFAILPVRSFSTETFNWKDPASTALGWIYLLYNRIEPDYSRLMQRPVADLQAFSMTGYPDIFTPYPSWDKTFSGEAFADPGARSWQGLPSADATLLQKTNTAATVLLSHESVFDETRRASVRLILSKGTDGTWKVDRMEREVATTLVIATDEDNKMVISSSPVYLTQQQAADGYALLISALENSTGIKINTIRQEGTALNVDLPESMRFFLNEGSTGSAMRINTLVRTMLSIPEARTARFTIDGEADVEMDHYSFRGAYTLNDQRALLQVSAPIAAAPAEKPEAVAEMLFAALASESYDTFAQFADPEKGTTMAIYGFVTEDAPVFDSQRWFSVGRDERVYQFGTYDGSGFPIQETAAEWLHLFFVPHRERSEWERTITTGAVGTGLATPEDIWPQATHVTYRWAGSDQYDGMDWRSITFVLVKGPAGWRLIGLVSNQWTI